MNKSRFLSVFNVFFWNFWENIVPIKMPFCQKLLLIFIFAHFCLFLKESNPFLCKFLSIFSKFWSIFFWNFCLFFWSFCLFFVYFCLFFVYFFCLFLSIYFVYFFQISIFYKVDNVFIITACVRNVSPNWNRIQGY